MSSLCRAAVALAVVLTAAGCDTGDGRTLRPPEPGVTAPPQPTSTTSTTSGAVIGPPVGSEAAGALVLSSSAFQQGTTIPTRFTCDGENVSPPLGWTGVPDGTVELALTMRDPDAPSGDFVHLVLTGIDPSVTGLGEGGVPETVVAVQPWTGPCPPPGETHTYVFTVHALTAPSGVTADGDTDAAIAALEAAPGLRAVLTAPYARPSG